VVLVEAIGSESKAYFRFSSSFTGRNALNLLSWETIRWVEAHVGALARQSKAIPGSGFQTHRANASSLPWRPEGRRRAACYGGHTAGHKNERVTERGRSAVRTVPRRAMRKGRPNRRPVPRGTCRRPGLRTERIDAIAYPERIPWGLTVSRRPPRGPDEFHRRHRPAWSAAIEFPARGEHSCPSMSPGIPDPHPRPRSRD
jgi:hypothetical protein